VSHGAKFCNRKKDISAQTTDRDTRNLMEDELRDTALPTKQIFLYYTSVVLNTGHCCPLFARISDLTISILYS
jgi:hypothetical protein